ncbi:galactokinase [Longirhabdus pacifica]|uniref:galactokinase n=1 Tax=Longirhabdus pacifica TaxID=2305227 RepID=UPI0010088A16|nr:galactokinase [Longirhabdus pacifica]
MNVTEEFSHIFGSEGSLHYFFAPGRVNLIGEHIDYNGGHVFPCALDVGTYAVARIRSDRKIRMYSINFRSKGIVEAALDALEYDEQQGWANYPIGIAHMLQKETLLPFGVDVLYYGNIPNGAGLSSSASIELVTAVLFNDLFGLHKDKLQLVQLSQQVENDFIGVKCGIMDQFAVGFGKRDHAVLLDCQTLSYEYYPINLVSTSIVIANTNKKRELADSAYNARRATCERALKKLQAYVTVDALAHITPADFVPLEDVLTLEEVKRVRHVVTEEYRTKQAAEALKQGDLVHFGALMKQSHLSLKNDYEVTGLELDTLVEAAWQHEACIGARMTGAGFGGCTVNIVKDEGIEAFKEQVSVEYEKIVGYAPSFYTFSVGEGASSISEQQCRQEVSTCTLV